MISPLINELDSLNKNITTEAISETWAIRPSGIEFTAVSKI